MTPPSHRSSLSHPKCPCHRECSRSQPSGGSGGRIPFSHHNSSLAIFVRSTTLLSSPSAKETPKEPKGIPKEISDGNKRNPKAISEGNKKETHLLPPYSLPRPRLVPAVSSSCLATRPLKLCVDPGMAPGVEGALAVPVPLQPL